MFYLVLFHPDIIIREQGAGFCFQQIEVGKEDAMGKYMLHILSQEKRIMDKGRQLQSI